MQTTNAFFKQTDNRSSVIAGTKIPVDWWSRVYEYGWALQYAEPCHVVADMGAGWMGRPFKSALAEICGHVYAVDMDERLLNLPRTNNTDYLIADFSKHVDLPDGSLDRIFCISVLEDLGENIYGALLEFARLLKPDGLVVATFDVQYDILRPLGKYPSVDFNKLSFAMQAAGLRHAYNIDTSKAGAIYHKEFNLCCFHAVMRKA